MVGRELANGCAMVDKRLSLIGPLGGQQVPIIGQWMAHGWPMVGQWLTMVGQRMANHWPTTGHPLANNRPTIGQHWACIREDISHWATSFMIFYLDI